MILLQEYASNFASILALYENSHSAISAEIGGVSYNDEEIRETVKETYTEKEVFQVAARRIVLTGGTSSLQGIKEKTESF